MSLNIDLRLRSRNFDRNLNRARQNVRKTSGQMKSDFSGVGESLSAGIGKANAALGTLGVGLGVGAIVQQLRDLMQEAQQLENISRSVAEPIDALARLRHASRALGVDFETAAELTRELEDRLGDLGNTEPMEALERLGLDAEEFMAMPVDQKILALSNAFQSGRDTGVAYSDMLKLLGDSVGEQLLPILTSSSEELESLFDEIPDNIAEMNAVLADAESSVDQFWSQFRNEATVSFAKLLEFGEKVADVMGDAESAVSLVFGLPGLIGLGSQMPDKLEAANANADARKLQREEEAERRTESAKMRAEAIAAAREEERALKDAAEKEREKTAAAKELTREREKQLKIEQQKREEEQRAAEQAAAEREIQQEKLESLREDASEGAMELMSPEEQARKLREQVGESLGIAGRVTEDNIARGLAALQGQVDSARESGDADAEEAALERLISAQDRVSDLRNAANGLSDVTAQSGELGSIARLFNQVSGRDPNERSAESLSNLERSSQDQITRLDRILGKMDVQPDVFEEFTFTP